ncbi:MAG: hypothetical protein ABR588_03790 [Sphingomicrobium sp.]|nr:hypothetical protein [Sphingomonadales bacterium]
MPAPVIDPAKTTVAARAPLLKANDEVTAMARSLFPIIIVLTPILWPSADAATADCSTRR